MKNKDFNEILKKCFGKEKDEKYHAIAMLIIYAIFLLIVVLMIRLGGNAVESESNDNTNTNQDNNIINPNPSQTPPTESKEEKEEDDSSINGSDINYSYSYTITYNGVSEVYLGKKLDDKEKFTLIKDGITKDYAVLSDSYLILENDIYHITESPSEFFKYCDVNEILSLIENDTPIDDNNSMIYSISNSSLSHSFNDKVSSDNNQTNKVILTLSNGNLKSIDLDFSNYISSKEGNSSTLTIHMEFVDIGKTEDFEIKVS